MPLVHESFCPLCHADRNYQKLIDNAQHRDFMSCTVCDLVYVPKQQHLSPADEKHIYDYHENDPSDDGYRRFLSKLATPLSAKLTSKCDGLDFGCGPGPTLHHLFEELGHTMSVYDPMYHDDRELLERTYDFVCATEVVEHFKEPAEHFDQLASLVKPGGYLGLMTKLNKAPSPFSSWHYTRDTTHIAFYSEATFHYLKKRYRCTLEIIGNDVIIMKKL